MSHQFQLPVPKGGRGPLASIWLQTGTLALFASAMFALFLPVSGEQLLHAQLAMDRDLLASIWLLAFAGALWSINGRTGRHTWDWLAWGLTASGALALALLLAYLAIESPASEPFPLLRNPLLQADAGLLLAGFAFLVLRSLATRVPLNHTWNATDVLRIGLLYSKISAALALLAFAVAYFLVPGDLQGPTYDILVLRGGMHVLQFTFSLLLIVACLWLAHASGLRIPLRGHAGVILFSLAFSPVLLVPAIFLFVDILSVDHANYFSKLGRYAVLAFLPLLAVLLIGLLRRDSASETQRPLRANLHGALLLFILGSLLGLQAQGVERVMPAHFQAASAGVTLAFMGVTFLLLPKLGYEPVIGRLAQVQPWIFIFGQLMLMFGPLLALGYGFAHSGTVTTGAVPADLAATIQIMNALGGPVANLGVLLFVFLVFKSWRAR